MNYFCTKSLYPDNKVITVTDLRRLSYSGGTPLTTFNTSIITIFPNGTNTTNLALTQRNVYDYAYLYNWTTPSFKITPSVLFYNKLSGATFTDSSQLSGWIVHNGSIVTNALGSANGFISLALSSNTTTILSQEVYNVNKAAAANLLQPNTKYTVSFFAKSSLSSVLTVNINNLKDIKIAENSNKNYIDFTLTISFRKYSFTVTTPSSFVFSVEETRSFLGFSYNSTKNTTTLSKKVTIVNPHICEYNIGEIQLCDYEHCIAEGGNCVNMLVTPSLNNTLIHQTALSAFTSCVIMDQPYPSNEGRIERRTGSSIPFMGAYFSRMSYFFTGSTLPTAFCANCDREEVIISGSNYSVPSNAFSEYDFSPKKLRSVTISGATGIKSEAFSYCGALTSVTLSDTVKSIGEKCFYQSALTTISFPCNGVTSIGKSAFEMCNSLASVIFQSGRTYTSVVAFGEYAFANCSSLDSVQIPAGTRGIGNYCFYRDVSLKHILAYPTLAPSFGAYTFDSVGRDGIVAVQSSAINVYQTYWVNSGTDLGQLGWTVDGGLSVTNPVSSQYNSNDIDGEQETED